MDDSRVAAWREISTGVRRRKEGREVSGDGREGRLGEDELAQRISVRIFLQKRDNAKKRADQSGQAGTDAA